MIGGSRAFNMGVAGPLLEAVAGLDPQPLHLLGHGCGPEAEALVQLGCLVPLRAALLLGGIAEVLMVGQEWLQQRTAVAETGG